MSLQQTINDIRNQIKNQDWNEADIQDYAVRPVLLALGWPDQHGIIRRQFSIQSKSGAPSKTVDFALFHETVKNTPIVLIEVKKSDTPLNTAQLFEYAHNQDAPLAILTNGKNWRFYYPKGDGNQSQRCFCDLNISHDPETSTAKLIQYLHYNKVVDNLKAFKDEIKREREKAYANQKLHDTWKKIVNASSLTNLLERMKTDTLKDLLRSMVKAAHGYDLSRDQIESFLNPGLDDLSALDTSPPQGTTWSTVSSGDDGTYDYAKSKKDTLIEIFNEVIKLNPYSPQQDPWKEIVNASSLTDLLKKTKTDTLKDLLRSRVKAAHGYDLSRDQSASFLNPPLDFKRLSDPPLDTSTSQDIPSSTEGPSRSPRPTPQDTTSFTERPSHSSRPTPPPQDTSSSGPYRSPHPTPPPQDTPSSSVQLEFTGFVLYGRRHYANSGIAILVRILNELIKLNPSFPELFAKSDFNFYRYQNRYMYLSRNRNDLPRPKKTRQLDLGWWINDDLGIKRIDGIIREACRVSGVKYGSDLIVRLPPGKNDMHGYQPAEQAFPKRHPPLHTAPSQGTTASPVSSARGFVLNGRRYYANSGIAILVGVLNELIKLNPSFAERFVKSHFNFNFRKNKYKFFSRNRNDLQDPKPRNVRQLDSGWWINDDLDIEGIDQIIQEACRFAEVKYGSDLIVHLPPGRKERSQAFSKGFSDPPLRTSPSQDIPTEGSYRSSPHTPQDTPSSSVRPEFTGFVLYGRRHSANSGIAILVKVFDELIKLNPSFAERFAKCHFNFNLYKNRYKYLSRNRNDLQDPQPVRQLDSGWWINDDLDIKRIDRIIQEACRVAEVKYGFELIVRLPSEK